MRYCECMSLEPGMVLAKALYSETNELLLSQGFELTEALIERVQRMGLSPVCVEESGTEEVVIEDTVDESVQRAANNSVKEVFDDVIKETKQYADRGVDDVVNELKSTGFAVPLTQVKKAVSSLIDELLDNMTMEWGILPLKFITGNHFRHGVDVAVLSLLIGIHFQFRHRELKHLGLGAVLHDLGMTLMPELMDKRNSDFSAQEGEQYRKHPQYGVGLLINQDEALYIEKECIHQHHEQPNGQGFPRRLISSPHPPSQRSNPSGNEIFRLAEIIHVADAYLNLTTGGWTQEAKTPEGAITEIVRGAPGLYNPPIVSALSQIVVRFPKGAHVQIIKSGNQKYIGYHAVVSVPNKQEPHHPVLVLFADRMGAKIKPLQVDFSAEKRMEIRLVV